jgi:mono/diheme cytochrome c family protein
MEHTRAIRTPLVLGAILAAVLYSGFLAPHDAADAAKSDLVARGAYLTGPAGRCSDCHGQGLHGGHVIPAPNLAGLTMFASNADAVKFFHTALTPAGTTVPPPMPNFMFNTADARAIVAYLRQLR